MKEQKKGNDLHSHWAVLVPQAELWNYNHQETPTLVLWGNHLKSCDLFFIQDGTSRDREEIVRSGSNKCKFSQQDELLLEHCVLQDAEEQEWVGNESGCLVLLEPRRDFFELALYSSTGLFIALKVGCQIG